MVKGKDKESVEGSGTEQSSLAIGYCDPPHPVSVRLSICPPLDTAIRQKQYGMDLIHIWCSHLPWNELESYLLKVRSQILRL